MMGVWQILLCFVGGGVVIAGAHGLPWLLDLASRRKKLKDLRNRIVKHGAESERVSIFLAVADDTMSPAEASFWYAFRRAP